jgi:hypothetical protein
MTTNSEGESALNQCPASVSREQPRLRRTLQTVRSDTLMRYYDESTIRLIGVPFA